MLNVSKLRLAKPYLVRHRVFILLFCVIGWALCSYMKPPALPPVTTIIFNEKEKTICQHDNSKALTDRSGDINCVTDTFLRSFLKHTVCLYDGSLNLGKKINNIPDYLGCKPQFEVTDDFKGTDVFLGVRYYKEPANYAAPPSDSGPHPILIPPP